MDKKLFFKMLGVVFLVAVVCCSVVWFKNRDNSGGEERNHSAEPSKPVVNENDEFYIAMLKLENKKTNMIYSPLSIRHALGLVNEGSKGQTKEEIDKVLGDDPLNKYNNIKDHLSLANSLFINDAYKSNINQDYINNVSDKYGAEIKFDSFKDASNVNNWISDKTFGMLKKIVSDDSVQDPYLRMLLINALAVDMEWNVPFDATDTHSADFNSVDGKKQEVTMMSTSDYSLSYYKDDKVQAFSKLLKQYDDYQFEFIGICPENLEEYIQDLNQEKLDKVVGGLKDASDTDVIVEVDIPKFEYEYKLPLVENLQTLGIKTMFDKDKADLSGISSQEQLYISDGIHKAKIEFGEKGLKAAAVTVFYAKANTAMEQPEPINIVFDKPFMFIVREKNTNDIWFVGTVYQPNLWKNDKANYEEK